MQRKLNSEWIKERTQGKITLSYVTFTKAIELMNEAFTPTGWRHAIKVMDPISRVVQKNKAYFTDGKYAGKKMTDIEEWLCQAKVTLFLPGDKIVEGLGTCQAEWNQFDTAYKGASSDAFKKAMTFIGFFMELYPDSTDNPLWWREMNKKSGLPDKLAETCNANKLDPVDMVTEWSITTFGTPAVYYTKQHIMHLHPEFFVKFIDWINKNHTKSTTRKKATKTTTPKDK